MSRQSLDLGNSFLSAVNAPVWNALGYKELETANAYSRDSINERNERRLNGLISRCQKQIDTSLKKQPAVTPFQKWVQSFTHGREDVPGHVESGADVTRMLLRAQEFSGRFNGESRGPFVDQIKKLIAELPETYAGDVAEAIVAALDNTIKTSLSASMQYNRVADHSILPYPIYVPLWDRGLRIGINEGGQTGIIFNQVPLQPFWKRDLG